MSHQSHQFACMKRKRVNMDRKLKKIIGDLTAEECRELAEELEQAAQLLLNFDVIQPCASPESVWLLPLQYLPTLTPDQLARN